MKIRPAGSFIVVADDLHAPMPDFEAGALHVWANESNVSFGTLQDADGETHLRVVESDGPFSGLSNVFDGVIHSPSRRVTLSDAHLTEYAAVEVAGERAHVSIWTNDPREPDEVVVSIRSA